MFDGGSNGGCGSSSERVLGVVSADSVLGCPKK